MGWHVLYTKSRQEKALASDLAARGIDHYLPITRQVRYYGKRKAKAELPLFPGYVFLRGDKGDAITADRTRRVVRILPVADEERLTEQLAHIRLALAENRTLTPHDALTAGESVRVKAGPLRGITGKVARTEHGDRLVLSVDMIGRASSLEIDRDLLELVH